MVINRKRFLLATAMSVLFLTACTDNENPKEDEPKPEEQETTVETLTHEKAIDLADHIFSEIQNEFTQAATDYNIQNGQMTDAIYDAMKPSFTPYATSKYIEGQLKDIAFDYCYQGCDAHFFPSSSLFAIDTKFNMLSETEGKLSMTFNANELMPNAYEESILFKYEDKKWKVEKTTYETIALNLSEKDAEAIIKKRGYKNPEFIEEAMASVTGGSEEKVYRFKTTELNIAITETDGFIYEESVNEEAPSAGGTLFTKHEAKYEAADAKVEKLRAAFNGMTTVEINQHTEEVLLIWDDLLNEMYADLKAHLPSKEFEQLRTEQREWITERDDYASFKASEFTGGTMYNSVYMEAQTEKTQSRCLDFLYDYFIHMK